ncbi:hypothetical protein ACKWTF_009684 [Chironomus riparius]
MAITETKGIKKKHKLTKIPITRTKRPINSFSECGKTTFCKICSKIFEYPSELSKHMLYHDNSRKFKCGLCELRFKNMTGLSLHKMHIHSAKHGKINKK